MKVFSLQAGLEYDTTSQQYIGTPTLAKAKPKAERTQSTSSRRGRKRKNPEKAAKGKTSEDGLQLATHAMSWMICGIVKRFKTVLAYDFTDSSYDAEETVKRLYEVVQVATECGLKVKGLVMDNSPQNLAI